jgi:purine-binding chemotaxis protein CheW
MSPESSPANIDLTHSKFLLFKINEGLFCMNLDLVDRVIFITETQPVPGMPAYFIGLLNLHNNKVPIIDLAIKLQIRSESNYTVDTPIILCQHEAGQVGFLVDEAIDVENIILAELKTQNLFQNEAAAYLQGSINTTHGDALLFNPQKIFDENIMKVG